MEELSQQQIKTMLADAAQIIQQAANPATQGTTATVQAVPMSAPRTPPVSGSTPVSPQHQGTAPVMQGTPVTLAERSDRGPASNGPRA